MEPGTRRFLEHEARALLSRLERVRPLALSDTMVPAANVAPAAQRAIDHHLFTGRARLRAQIGRFVGELKRSTTLTPALGQRRLALLRLRFTAALGQFDLYADAMAQRSQRDSGVWLAGLDALARDALAMPGHYTAPPLLCYLDRGIGAAIRRARTRLPGGGENPVAVIRVPRERLVGSGIASSLVHEVGHQAVALLGLLDPLRGALRTQAALDGNTAWAGWQRWISEIVADLWSVARLGIASTYGLIGVVSLPPAFVFRGGGDDPHPPPWLRVLVSAALGQALYPHPQWQQLSTLWRSLYPLASLPPARARPLALQAASIPAFVALLLAHRQPALGTQTLGQALARPALQASALRHTFETTALFSLPPCHACAVLGQTRADATLAPEDEGQRMAQLLTHWALRQSLAARPDPIHRPPRF